MAVIVNGKLPNTLLTSIGGSHRLRHEAASAWNAVVAEVKRVYGWTPTPSAGLTSYRTVAEQEQLFRANYTTTNTGLGYKIWNGVRWYRRPGSVDAAVPGTSNHGLGLAVDVAGLGSFTSTRFRQFSAVATRFNLSNAQGRSVNEYWHWVYVGYVSDTAPKPGTSAPGVPSPTPNTNTFKKLSKEDNMWQMIREWYVERLGRQATTTEVAIQVDANANKTMMETLQTLENSRAEPSTVILAYSRVLGRDPSKTEPQVIDWRVNELGQTVAEVWQAVLDAKK